MTSTSIFIFDLPHITDLIAQQLDLSDLRSCALVNKGFNVQFTPALWNKIFIDNSKIESLIPGLCFVPGHKMMANLRWTKQMFLDADCRKDLLPLLLQSCRDLKDLTTRIDDQTTLFVVLDLVADQARLKNWTISYRDIPTMPALERLNAAISHSLHLRELEIMIDFTPGRREWFGDLLKNLPHSLAKLNVAWDDPMDVPGHDQTISYPAQDWPTETKYPHLTSVEFGMDLLAGEEDLLVQFLNRCPALQRLDLPTMTSTQLDPVLSLLGPANPLSGLKRFYLGWTNLITEHQWRDLIYVTRGQIENFSVDTDFRSPSTFFVPDMIRHWSTTLQSLQFLYLSPIYNEHVQLILTTCTGLETFECTSVADQEAPATHSNSPNDVNEPGLDTADWVCLGLEQLQIVFVNVLRPDDSQAEDKVKYLYRQIGRLTKLKELSIGWRATEELAANVHLDMSLGSGLWAMQELKFMEMLDISRICNVNIGPSEATWMLENWPRLKTIRGLRYRTDGPDLDLFLCPSSGRLDLTAE